MVCFYIKVYFLIPDISVTNFAVGLVEVDALYQDTWVPLTYSADISYTGRPIGAPVDMESHIGISIYLSTDATLDPSDTLLAHWGDSPLHTPLNSSLVSGTLAKIEGTTEVLVRDAQCNNQDFFLCGHYTFLSYVQPHFKEDAETQDNDASCFNVTDIMACHDGMLTVRKSYIQHFPHWAHCI